MTKVMQKSYHQLIIIDIQTIYVFFISKLCIEREKHINTDYDVTGCMLCVITHIREDVFNIPNINNINQVNTVIKTLFY